MKYEIDKKNDNFKLVNHKVNINGLNIKPINNVSNVYIKANSITLVDKLLVKSYINHRLNNKINKIINFMMFVINNDSDDEDGYMALNEINRLKGIIDKKYKEHLLLSEYNNYINKLCIIEEEFKNSYSRKQYINYISNNYYEEMNSGMSR